MILLLEGLQLLVYRTQTPGTLSQRQTEMTATRSFIAANEK